MNDKYLVIWWNTDREDVRVSMPVSREQALTLAMAISNNEKISQVDESGESEDENYGDWSIIVTKYQPILEKDLRNEFRIV